MDEHMLKAAFLDRDGVINRDLNYIYQVSDFEFMAGAIEGMQRLQNLGYILVVVTNQSGIGRGYFSEAAYQALTEHMIAELGKNGVKLQGIYHCPHEPTADSGKQCSCRKPAPGLILAAAKDLNVDLSASILVGDKQSDLEAGRAAGVARCYLLDDRLESTAGIERGIFPTLLAVAEHLMA